jgi:hypothetical protein
MRARIITTVFASFFHSCSNGGRQALTEAERGPAPLHPLDNAWIPREAGHCADDAIRQGIYHEHRW